MSRATSQVGKSPLPQAGELEAYRSQVLGYDEMFNPEGETDSAWIKVAERFLGLDSGGKEALAEAIRHAVREHGITYNVHGDPDFSPRPWLLDPVPFVINESDWKKTEAGLQQRAELLNAILDDLYGPQILLKEGLLPAQLVYRHPGFLHPCRGFQPVGGKRLILYGPDLARGPDGRMWVINDRTQAPSGPGYAIENRVIMARLLPELFRECGVKRLASPFRRYRDFLFDLAPIERREPRVVLLTPGPFNETYFEHAYLAAYLGVDLVQGSDLTVREARVWLKTLAGLEPVDVILRRVDEAFCDPLELRADSQLGVPGLVEAARQGNVAIANPLGNGVLENPGLFAFLPGICRFLRKEELILPSAATWWCGQKKERAFVLENLSKLVVKSISRAPDYQTVFCPSLTETELKELRARIEADPASFVGQELVSFASAPTLAEGRLQPRRTIIRSVVCATSSGYEVMPGGLTLSTTREEDVAVSYSRDGIAKDTWICGGKTEEHRSLWAERQRNLSELGPHHLSSRAGENLFWTGRYAERAEALARVLRRVLRIHFQNEEDALLGSESKRFAELRPALEELTSLSPTDEEGEDLTMDNYLSQVISSAASGSLYSDLQSFLAAAYSVRDLWSPDSWRVIGQVESVATSFGNTGLPFHTVAQEVSPLIIHLVALAGLNHESMTRDAGWRMLEIGRRLERSQALVTLVESFMLKHHDDHLSSFRMETLLAASDSLVTHRRRYRAEPVPASVLELLLIDENNPRSLIYQLIQMESQIRALPGSPESPRLAPEAKLVMRKIAEIRLGDLDDLLTHDADSGKRIELGKRLQRVSAALLAISELLNKKYFIHVSARLRD